ncbi:MAG TPA: protein kinase, partial [Gemmatimonadaceae bacterium]|nr:protein kinase [Gemmatimonadaceae bacterium]
MNEIGSPSRLQAALGGQYVIERELGGGGMSRTYVARETALDRRVVIKVLPPDLAATVSHDRFRREILVSAQLQHPNIVGILTTGEVDELPYFTMPFVDGESLRMRLQRHGPLSIAQTVSILRDVARALAFAHERGIVHRDVKPDNVLLTSGAAVVADFGVAKALSSARVRRHKDDDATITTAGTALGTPTYMAPEQAAGDPSADHRADLYAFGVMAYEMIAGEAPFSGRAPAQLLAAHISETPAHIATSRADVPRALADLVMRCLEKEPAHRPQNAAEVALALEDPAMVSGAFASAPTLSATRASRRPRLAQWIVRGLAAAGLVGGGIILARPTELFKSNSPNATTPQPPVVDARSIAVLPLVNLSGDSNAYLANGITDELTSALSRVNGFRIASRTAAQAAQSKGAGPQEIGSELNVAYLLEGTVQRQGNQLRITTRLVNASDGFTTWSAVYDRQANDLFKVQDQVARAVVDALSTELGVASTAGLTGTSDPTAYDHYLRGRSLFQKRDPNSLPLALKEYQTAVKLDPAFARAHAGVASVFAVLPLYGEADPRTAAEQGLAAANTALRLDSTIAEGYAARGVLQMMQWRFDDAGKDLERARRLDPSNPLALQWLGELRLVRGDAPGAEEALAQASRLDPTAPITLAVGAMAQQSAGRTDSALIAAQRALNLDPALYAPRLIYGTLLLDAGRAREAVRELEKARSLQPNSPATLGAVGAAYAASGERARAEEVLTLLHGMQTVPRAASAIAKVRLALGDRDSAIVWLGRAADAHDPAFTSE